jgi:hypothetical protein
MRNRRIPSIRWITDSVVVFSPDGSGEMAVTQPPALGLPLRCRLGSFVCHFEAAAAPNTIGIQNNADATVTVTFAGTPDARYLVHASDNLAPPAWENVSTNTAGTDGQWTFTESTERHPVRFYRSAKP